MLAELVVFQPHQAQADEVNALVLARRQDFGRLARLGAKIPAEHHAVVGAPFFVDGLGEPSNFFFADARAAGGFANVERDAVARAVDERRDALRFAAEGFDDELAEYFGRVLLQLGCFVDAPVLDGEIRHGEEITDFIFNNFRHAVGGDGNGDAALVAGQPAAVETLGYSRRGASAAEEIGNYASFVRK